MEHKNIVVSGIVLLLIIGGMFVFAYLKKAEINSETPTPTQQETVTTPYDNITRIDAKHFFIEGTHTLVGEVAMPTPCDLLNWDAKVAKSDPEQVTIDFTVINDTETCPPVITTQRFKISFVAGSSAVMNAFFEGRAIELNLIPALEGETPDDFELFIKG